MECPPRVGIAGLAAGRQHDGHARRPAVVPHDVEVGQAELVGGEFRQDLDAEPIEPVEQGPGLRPDVGARKVDEDAAVERPEDEAVAVALQALEEAVAHGPVDVWPRPEPVGDERREGLVALGQFEEIAGRDVERHVDPRAVARPHGGGPGQRRRAVDRAPRRQAERQRVHHAVAPDLAHQGVVGPRAVRLLAQPQGGADHLGDLGQGADDGLAVRRAVAVAARHGAPEAVGLVEEEPDLPGRHAGGVERRHGEADVAAEREGVDVAPGRLGHVGRKVVHGWVPRVPRSAAER